MAIEFEDAVEANPREFITSKGERVFTFLTDEEAYELLARNCRKLSHFTNCLLSDYKSKKGLSERQLPWFHKAALDLVPTERRPGYTGLKADETLPAVIVDLSPIRAMINKAIERITSPRISFSLSHDRRLCIRVATAWSLTPGALMVTDGKGSFYGRVHLDGRWEESRNPEPWVQETLISISQDPAKFVGDYGRLTGYCCFCGLPLTDPRSVGVGYGPYCAETYGLPWGTSKD